MQIISDPTGSGSTTLLSTGMQGSTVQDPEMCSIHVKQTIAYGSDDNINYEDTYLRVFIPGTVPIPTAGTI